MVGSSQQDEASERTLFAAPEAAPFTAVPVPAGKQRGVVGESQKKTDAPATPEASRPVLRVRRHPWRWLKQDIATEVDRGIVFILSPVFIAIGAVLYFALSSEPGLFPLAAGVFCLMVASALTRSQPLANVTLIALTLVVAGMAAGRLETLRAGTKMLGGEISTQLTGRVAAIEHMATGRVRLTIDVVATERPVLRYAPDRVRVSARAIPAGVEAGSTIVGLVRLMPPSGPVRPGSYDFSFESYFDGIGASGFFLRGPELAASAATPSAGETFTASVERARDGIAARIRDRIGGPEGEIAAALVVGVRAGIPEDVNEALRRAGIYHIISISGLHMALVAGTIMGLLRAGFALAPGFSSRRPVKKYAAALAIIGLAAYLFISGGEVAAQRSFIMIAIMLVAVLFDRAALTMRNLALSALVVIALSPHEVIGPSFQMSFAATAALVGAYAAWSDYRAARPARGAIERSWAGKLVHMGVAALAGLAAMSLVAGGATAIYSAYHFQQMPSLGLFTNLAAMPIVSILVMPFAVLGTLAMPFGLDGPFFDVMGLGLAATIAVARWFSERSPIDIVGLISPLSVALFTFALVIATVATTRLRLAALPLALAAIIALPGGQPPDILVSEDGRLAGLSLGGGAIAVNRSRPNEFTIENWQRAMRAATVVKPREENAARQMIRKDGEPRLDNAGTMQAAVTDPGGKPPTATGAVDTETASKPPPPPEGKAAGLVGAAPPKASDPEAPNPSRIVDVAALLRAVEQEPGFACAEGLCLAQHASGVLIAHAADATAAAAACRTAGVIVLDDASSRNPCRNARVLVVTKRDLARRGAAAIWLETRKGENVPAGQPASGSGAAATMRERIDYAVSEPYRPWHDHRRFSREARGLPAYVRTTKSTPEVATTSEPPASAAPKTNREKPAQ